MSRKVVPKMCTLMNQFYRDFQTAISLRITVQLLSP